MGSYNEPTRLWLGPWYRKSPYFEATQEAGCKGYDIYNHMLLPAGYSDWEEEYWRLKNDVTVWDVSVERQVEISGPDALPFTNMLTPRDLTNCDVGQCKYVVLTDQDGGIINDPVLARVEEDCFWLAIADSDALLWAKGVAVFASMDVTIREPDVSPMQIQGPKAKDVVHALFGDEVLSLPYYHCMKARLGDIPVLITRTGWTGEVGYELYLCDRRYGRELWNRVVEAGEPYNIAAIAPSDARRIEAGILNYGSDMTLENNPYEVGLGWMVNLEQEADFIGKEALQRINEEGIERKLVGIEINGDPLQGWPEEPWPVYQNGDQIGRVSAAVYSPGLEKNIGYAMVPIEHADRGTTLKVDTPWDPLPATVVRKPFVDPKKKIPKS